MTGFLGSFWGFKGKNGRSDWIRTSDPYPPRKQPAAKPLKLRVLCSRLFAFGVVIVHPFLGDYPETPGGPMTDIHIPPAALEAGARAIQDMRYATHIYGADDIARAAFVAMVTAWPKWLDMDADPGAALILPLTEKQDDQA